MKLGDRTGNWVGWFPAGVEMEEKREELWEETGAEDKGLPEIRVQYCVLGHTYPGLDLTVSGRPLFVGVVAML